MLALTRICQSFFIEILKIAYAAEIVPVGRINIQCITVTKALHYLKY